MSFNFTAYSLHIYNLSIVSYTNTLPFRWALRKFPLRQAVISEDIPSVCADKLIDGRVNLALVPVAVLPRLKHYSIVSDYCIGADGIVDSVKLYSSVPLEDVTRVMLDYQSRTSIALTRVLFRHHWKLNPVFEQAVPGFESRIGNDGAAVVIGDRTFALNDQFAYEYDLAAEWKAFTGLPFVFAVWAATSEPDRDFLSRFNDVMSKGVANIDTAIRESPLPPGLTKAKLQEYLTERIDYRFDERKKEALSKFLSYLSEF